MEWLSKSNSAVNKIKSHLNEIIETPNAIKKEESHVQEERGFNADKILEIEQEAELLREQVETLKQELQYERQLVKEYHQELLCTNSEMIIINRELQDVRRARKAEN